MNGGGEARCGVAHVSYARSDRARQEPVHIALPKNAQLIGADVRIPYQTSKSHRPAYFT